MEISIEIIKYIQISSQSRETLGLTAEPRADHVNFLATWDPKSSLDSKAFRLASVSDPWLKLLGHFFGG